METMTIGLIGGTGTDFSLEWTDEVTVPTKWGDVPMLRSITGGTQILFIARHGRGHHRLSSQVSHRANIAALKQAGACAIFGTTVCGIVDPAMPLGRAIVFDDLFFPDNRLPEGDPCTFFDTPGEPDRGHYIFGSPFSPGLRAALLRAAGEGVVAFEPTGTYACMLGPRFNTRSEIAWLRSVGATAVSQTAGPEAVLAGELELPYALVGFGVDHANGVMAESTPTEVLDANIAASASAFDTIVRGAVDRVSHPNFDTGFVYRFE